MFECSTAEEVPASSPGLGFPAVPASARMAELMERAASRLMRRELSAGETSTSIRLGLWHLARITSTPESWRVEARRSAIRCRVHEIQVDVFDDSGLIAGAEHARAVVVSQRFEALARRRAGRPSMLLRA